MRRLALGFLIALLPTLLAAQALTPARELIPSPVPLPARANAIDGAVATDNVNILTVFPDVLPRSRGFFTSNLYANVVRPDGSTTSPTRILLDDTGRAPDAVWTGNDYFVVWADTGNIWFTRLDPDGRPLAAEPTRLGTITSFQFAQLPRPSIVWTGERAHVVWGAVRLGSANALVNPTMLATIERDGTATVRELPLRESFHPAELALTLNGLLLTGYDNLHGVVTERLTADGTPAGVTHIIAPDRTVPTIAANGNQFLIVWSLPSQGLRGRLLDANGAPRGEPFTIFSSDFHTNPAVAAARSGFVVISRAGLRTALLDANGQVVDERRLDESIDGSASPAVLPTEDGRLAVLYSTGSLPRLQFYGALSVQRLGDPILVSKSAPQQMYVDSEAHPAGHLVVWQEGDNVEGRILSMVVDAAGNPLREPHELMPLTGVRRTVELTRLGDRYFVFAGESWLVLDQNGFPAGGIGRFEGECAITHAVTNDEDGLLLFRSRCNGSDIGVARLDANGTFVSETVLFQTEVNLRSMRVIRTGDHLYFAWLDGYGRLYGLRLALDGTPLEAPVQLLDAQSQVGSFELATDGDRVFIAWLSHNLNVVNDFIAGITVDHEGRVITGDGDAIEILTEGDDRKVLLDTWWNGTNYTIAWRSSPDDAVKQIRVNRDGHLMDAPPHRARYEQVPATVAVSRSGGHYLFLSLERMTAETHGNVFRIVTRAGLPPRRRAIR